MRQSSPSCSFVYFLWKARRWGQAFLHHRVLGPFPTFVGLNVSGSGVFSNSELLLPLQPSDGCVSTRILNEIPWHLLRIARRASEPTLSLPGGNGLRSLLLQGRLPAEASKGTAQE